MMTDAADNTGVAWQLHFLNGRSRKFYRQFVIGNMLITHHGRINTAGQVHIHHHSTPEACAEHAINKCAEKERKGYWSTVAPKPITLSPIAMARISDGLAPSSQDLDAALNGGT